jgi:hypothetical protein
LDVFAQIVFQTKSSLLFSLVRVKSSESSGYQAGLHKRLAERIEKRQKRVKKKPIKLKEAKA